MRNSSRYPLLIAVVFGVLALLLVIANSLNLLPGVNTETRPTSSTSSPSETNPPNPTSEANQTESTNITSVLLTPAAPAASTTAPTEAVPTPLPTADSQRVIIPIIAPLDSTIVDANTAAGIVNGAEMAFRDFSSLFEGLNISVELRVYSDRADVAQAIAVAQEIAADPNTLCVVGHYTSNTTIAAKETYKPASIASISPSSTDVRVTDTDWANWRLAGTDIGRGHASVKFAGTVLRARTAFVIRDISRPNYETAVASFENFSSQYNVRVVNPQGGGFNPEFPDTITAVVGEFAALIDANNLPDVVYIAANTRSSTQIIPLLRATGYKKPIIGADGMDSVAFEQFTEGNDLGKLYTVSVALPPDQAKDGIPFKQAYEAFLQEQGEKVDAIPPFAAESHDATYMCMRAIADSAKLLGRKPDRKEVLQAMRNLTLSSDFRKDLPFLYTDPYLFVRDRGDISGVYFVREIINGRRMTQQKYNCTSPECISIIP